MLNEKKRLCPFNEKTPLCAGLGSKQQKNFSNVKQFIRKKSVYCLKIRQFFTNQVLLKSDLTPNPLPPPFIKGDELFQKWLK